MPTLISLKQSILKTRKKIVEKKDDNTVEKPKRGRKPKEEQLTA